MLGLFFLSVTSNSISFSRSTLYSGMQQRMEADVGGIQRRVAGVAAEDAENADALVRADRGALAIDGVGGARDRGRKADAIFRVADIVVHRLRNRHHLDAEPVEVGGVAQRVVAADGDQVFKVELLRGS